ncbi:hypothetical protein RJT34_22169 [Clitoria ternatea]|uniref:RNase H type-1 domain-containing protein n=1 Tax=Clitoria ternatea TaxID=43366 RepID=A0AAN9IVV8_CLITE
MAINKTSRVTLCLCYTSTSNEVCLAGKVSDLSFTCNVVQQMCEDIKLLINPDVLGLAGFIRNEFRWLVRGFCGWFHSYNILASEVATFIQTSFHLYAALIRMIQDHLGENWDRRLNYFLREGNFCADWLAVFGVPQRLQLAVLAEFFVTTMRYYFSEGLENIKKWLKHQSLD